MTRTRAFSLWPARAAHVRRGERGRGYREPLKGGGGRHLPPSPAPRRLCGPRKGRSERRTLDPPLGPCGQHGWPPLERGPVVLSTLGLRSTVEPIGHRSARLRPHDRRIPRSLSLRVALRAAERDPSCSLLGPHRVLPIPLGGPKKESLRSFERLQNSEAGTRVRAKALLGRG
jgi:hypothetical protein